MMVVRMLSPQPKKKKKKVAYKLNHVSPLFQLTIKKNLIKKLNFSFKKTLHTRNTHHPTIIFQKTKKPCTHTPNLLAFSSWWLGSDIL
jgi:hypothetical protein